MTGRQANKIRVRYNLLYVEDDPVQAMLIKPVLEDESFAVVHVSNAYEALNVIQQRQFDIVLTDYRMPNMDGITLIKEVHKLGIHLPIVLLTAATDVSLAFAALEAGASDFITKDPDTSYLDFIAPVLIRSLDKFHLQSRAELLSQKLEEEKNLTHQTLDTLGQGVVVVDTDYQLRYCNRFFETLFEVPHQLAEAQASIHHLAPLLQNKGSLSGETEVDAISFILLELLKGNKPLGEFAYSDGRLFEVRSNLLTDSGFVLIFSDITLQKQQLQALSRTIEWAPVAMIAVDPRGQIVLANQRACALTEYEQMELMQCNLDSLLPQEVRGKHPALVDSYFKSLVPRRMRDGLELNLRARNGKLIPVEVSLSGIEIFKQPRVLATIVDISHRKAAERALRQAHELTQSIVESSPFSIIATNVDGDIVAVSPALEVLLQYRRDEVVGCANAIQFHLQEELKTRAAVLSSELSETIMPSFQVLVEKANRGVVESQKWSYVRKDGTVVPVSLTVTLLRTEDNVVTGYLLVAYDITEQLRASEEIEHIAHHDQLTGLPNRSLLQDRLDTALKRIKRFGKKVGILVLDLDRFKQINDTLGHLVGDQLLVAMAKRMSSVVRESDTVARMGGDEFVVLLPDLCNVQDAEMICEKIVDVVSQPLAIEQHTLKVTTSIGLCVAPEHGMDIETLIKHADIAMYSAKQEGRNRYQLYSEQLKLSENSDAELSQALHSAHHNEALQLHYQPQVNSESNQVIGFEALLRWNDPRRGDIHPDDFVPVAEKDGVIVDIGDWVLRKACQDIAALRSQLGQDFSVSINVSMQQFDQSDIVQRIERALSDSGLPADKLELEFAENALAGRGEPLLDTLNAIKKTGVKLVIDDFGTGGCNLSYIANVPVDRVKLDRSLLQEDEKANRAIISAVSAIAEGLELDLVAVGVETVRQLDFVNEQGCHFIQGFYFSQAVPLADVKKTLQHIRDQGASTKP